jgi:hypothetical protein
MNVADARAAWYEARETASLAYHSIADPAAKKYSRAVGIAQQISEPIPRDDVARYVGALYEAARTSDEILTGPTEDLDQALAEARSNRP